MPRLLVAEDDIDLGHAMRRALEQEGYVVDLVARGDEVLAAMGASDYDVVLLDVGLPYGSGVEVLRQLRSRKDMTSVIIVTALDRTRHRVAGLDAGADDYVVKPVDLEELAARVRAQLRRKDQRHSEYLSVGDVQIDFTGHVVTQNGKTIGLTAKEFRVLALLVRRSRRFVTKGDLEGELYDQDHGADSNTVEVAISALRRKLGHNFIRTARGLGYMVGGKS